jgi:hypothetical protein
MPDITVLTPRRIELFKSRGRRPCGATAMIRMPTAYKMKEELQEVDHI